MSVLELSPEIEAVLQELARQPGSRLLRVNRSRSVRPFLEDGGGVRANESFLSRPERYLIEAHREEVARVLLDACAMVSATQPLHGLFLHRHKRWRVPFDIPDQVELGNRARHAGASNQDDSEVRDGQALLQACVSGREAIDVLQLATASFRLVPSDAARIYAQIHLVAEGDLASAMRVLDVVLDGRALARTRAAALEGRGRIFHLQRAFDRAAKSYSAAFRANPDRLCGLPPWFANACWAGDLAEARVAAAEVDTLLSSPGDPIVAEWLSAMRSMPSAARPFAPKPDFLGALRDAVGPVSTRLLDESV